MLSFKDFLNESNNYIGVDSTQLSIIRQSFNKNSLIEEIKKEYIEDSDLNLKLVDSDFYVSAVSLYDEDKVCIKGMFIVEVTEADGYIYFKPVEFEYVIENEELLSVKDIDKIRDENWKNVQNFILKTSKKL